MKKSSPIFALCIALGSSTPLLACSDAATDVGAGGQGNQPGAAGLSGVAGNAAGGSSAGAPAQTGGVGGGSNQAGAAGSVSGAGGSSAGAPAEMAGAGGSSAGTGGTKAGGAGGAAGGSAAGGSAGAGGGKTDVKKSDGCKMSATQALGQFVESMVMSGSAKRPYDVRLPTGYDPMRAYPVVALLHGCGSGTNNVAMEKSTGADAILIRGTGSAADTCWDTKATGPDVAFFDAMVTDVKTRFCTDEHRFFVVGYSSGSWLVNQLTCIRASVLRGAASVTGGESASGGCGGPWRGSSFTIKTTRRTSSRGARRPATGS